MQPLVYNEASNIQLLKQLTAPLRVAFALLCALRILPTYRCFHVATGRGERAELEAMTDVLWRDINGDEMSEDELKSALDRCMSLVPSEQDGWDEATQPYAEDAAAAVAYAFRARLTEDPQEGRW